MPNLIFTTSRTQAAQPGADGVSRKSLAMALLLAFLGTVPSQASPGEMPWVQVSKDKKGFVLDPSGRPFVPWGFNYDHDDKGRLIEHYWDGEWPTVETHFGQMRKLGANVVRVHLQLGKFIDSQENRTARRWTASTSCWPWPSGCGSTST